MTTPHHPRPETDAYLDRQMPEAQRRAYEEVLRTDAEASADLARQARLDAALAELFDPGEPPELNFDAATLRPDETSTSRRAARPPARRLIAIAAGLLLLIAAAWALYAALGRGGVTGIDARRVYTALIENNFQPEEVCTDPDKFESYMKGRAGQGLLLSPSGSSVTLVGWAYAVDPKGGRVIILMVHDRGKPVIVFIEPMNMKRPITPPAAGSGLHHFGRQIGRLWLQEITPHAEPGVIQHLYNPEERGKV